MSSASSQSTYAVVARSASGAYFAPEEPLILEGVQTQHGAVRITFYTRRAPLPGFSKAVARGLCADIRGPAPSVDVAIDPFVQAANVFCPLISLSCNAPIEDLQPELAFDATPGAARRSFFQQFLLDERIMPIRRRRVPVELTSALAVAIAKHPESERLHRAAVHYYQALQYWRPGYETFALAHLYMGIETLVPVVRDAYLATNHLSTDDLRRRWSIHESHRVEPEVRLRLIFDNDAPTYRQAKGASDGLEHGFMPLPDIRASAVAVNKLTAKYLRRAILQHVGLPQDQLDGLLDAQYDEPFYLHYTKYMWGELEGEGDELAAPNQDYPILQWRSTIRELPTGPGETPRVQFVESYAERLAQGIRFRPRRVEVLGPAGTGVTPESDVVVPKIESAKAGKALGMAGVEWNRPEMMPFADAMTRFLLNFGTIDYYSRVWLAALTNGDETGENLSYVARLELLLARVQETEALRPLGSRVEDAWLPTKRLAAMQESITRSPILFGWKGPEGDREPDFAVMLRRSSPHWPDTPEPRILLDELAQATEDASAIATTIITMSAEIQELLAAGTSGEVESGPGSAVGSDL